MQVLLVEALIAFILVFTVISTTTDKRVPVGTAAVAIGFALAAGVFLGGPVSGGAGNPARALGPMIVAGTFLVWPEFAVHRHTVKIAAISAASRNSTVR
jgi:glycerol uptake facilitator-like aquaporin